MLKHPKEIDVTWWIIGATIIITVLLKACGIDILPEIPNYR